MNILLLFSSIFLGLIHLYAISISQIQNPIIIFSILTGITTSIINHASTNNVAKYADRFVMSLSFIINIYHKPTLLLFLAPTCYLFNFHLTSHILITIYHLGILA
jgi:hypothetical protein